MAKSKLLLLINAYRQQGSFWEQLGLSTSLKKDAKNKRSKKIPKLLVNILIGVALLIAVASIMAMLVGNFIQLELIGRYVKINGVGVFMGSLIAALITFMYATFTAGSTIYRAQDLKLLVTLPINGNTLLCSRFVIHYITNLSLYWVIMIPALIANAITYQVSARLISMGIVILCVGPVLPISLSMMYARVFASTASTRGKRRHAEVIALFVMIVLLMVLQGLSSRWLQHGFSEADISQLANSFGHMFISLFKWFPHAAWKAEMLVSESMMTTASASLWFLGSSIVLVLIVVLINQNAYTKLLSQSLGSSANGTSKRKKSIHGTTEVSVRTRSAVRTLVGKEFALINSQNSYMMELYAEAAIPLILVIVYFIGGTLGEITSMIDHLSNTDAFPFIFIGILLAMATISMMSSTSISREGRLLDFSKMLPVSPDTHVKAKVAAHLILFGTSYIIFMIIGIGFFPVPPVHMIWMVPLGLLAITVSSCISLTIDYRRPRLNWKLPQQAVKQNMNGIMGMISSLVLIAILAGITLLLLQVLTLPVFLIGVILCLLLAVSLYPVWKLVVASASRCYAAD